MSISGQDLAFGEDLLGSWWLAVATSCSPRPASPPRCTCTGAGRRRRPAAAAGGVAGDPERGPVLRASSTMWVRAGMALRPEFLAVLREAAAVSVRGADFARAAEAARQEINDLVAKQTEDKITDLLARGVLDGSTRLVLVNAIYLKAAWVCPFPGQATADALFRPGSGRAATSA